MTAPNPRALAERHGLSFHLEQRVPDHLTLVHHKQGCRPATDGETQLWTALARYALDREAGWQDIATAPKDKTEVQVFCEDSGEQFVAFRLGDAVGRDGRPGYQFASVRGVKAVCTPTHWRLIPPPPRGAETGDK